MDLVLFSLQTGLLLSAALCMVILPSLFFNPEIWVDDYPPDVRARFGPIGDRARRQRRRVALLFFWIPPLALAFSLPGLKAAAESGFGFGTLFFHAFLALEVFNLIDLLVLDWLLFVRIQPGRVILPGTQGMAGYQDYAFHFRGFLIGHIFILLFSLLFAGLSSLFV